MLLDIATSLDKLVWHASTDAGNSLVLGRLERCALAFAWCRYGPAALDGMSQKVVELCISPDLISPDTVGDYELTASA